MEHLADYPDSPDECKTLPKGKRPPPPPELLDVPIAKRRSEQALQLPQVVPMQPRDDSFLVHVYIPLAHPRLHEFVRKLMGMARLRLTGGKVKAAFTPLTDFHVSVARPVSIREARIQELVADLKRAVKRCSRIRLAIRASVEAFASGNGNRVFVAAPLTTSTGNEIAKDLINAIDMVFEKQSLPTFFKDPRPHMSFAWTEIVDVLPRFREGDSTQSDSDEDVLELVAEGVECSIGKSKYYFRLK